MNTDEAYKKFCDAELIGVAHHGAVTRAAFDAGMRYGIALAEKERQCGDTASLDLVKCYALATQIAQPASCSRTLNHLSMHIPSTGSNDVQPPQR